MIKNKKGDMSGEHMVYYTVYGVIFAIVALLFMYLLLFNSGSNTHIPNGIENEIFANRITDVCFSRGEPSTIYAADFNLNAFMGCYGNNHKKVRLILETNSLTDLPQIQTKGWEGYPDYIITRQVIFKDQETYNGELKIEIQES